jgi:8-oxo-dGTP pyrophosphatase MutT (NUDIX family)
MKPIAPSWIAIQGNESFAMIVRYAALPIRKSRSGTEVLLVTTRKRRHWIVPKGRREKQCEAHITAANEAFEEAGVVGKIQKQPLVTFSLSQQRRKRRKRKVIVKVFRLSVRKQLKQWRERGERRLRWLTPKQAANKIRYKPLKAVLRDL